MLNAIGDHTQGERCCPVARFVSGCSVDEDPWKLRDFADPAAIFFAFNFDRQHNCGSRSSWAYDGALVRNAQDIDVRPTL
jgi:hypothetical protein